MQRRILSLMSASARERYESFLQTYPELPNRVPQKMIASYLGITPEALSTIRNKINKKD
jgi:CRP-like cAMP-binding protein